MKKTKILALLAVIPLLGACNNSGVKSMKKPSFASYTNKYAESETYTFYEDYEKAGSEAFKANFKFKDDQLASLDKGFVLNAQGYQNLEYTVKLTNGNKQSYNLKQSSIAKGEFDASTLAGKLSGDVAMEMKYSNLTSAPNFAITTVGAQEVAVISTLPSFYKGSEDMSVNAKTEGYMMFYNNKAAEVNATTKTYETFGEAYTSEDDKKQALASQAASGAYTQAEDFAPVNDGTFVYDRYKDGNVFTSVYSQQASGITVKYSSGKEYQVTSKVERIYQANFDKLTFVSSEEVTIEMTGTAGTYKLVSKIYQKGDMANKKVSVKAPDLSKYTDVTPTDL